MLYQRKLLNYYFFKIFKDFFSLLKLKKLTYYILKSALIILLFHEIENLLKYYLVKNAYPDITPITPKGKENDQCLIYFF